MRLILDSKRYDKYEEIVLETMMVSIRQTLRSHSGISTERVDALAEEIAFSVLTIVDASTVMGSEGQPVLPFLAFSESDEERGHLIVNEYGSHLHERVMGYFDKT